MLKRIAIIGPPGFGKSTLAYGLAKVIINEFGIRTTVLPETTFQNPEYKVNRLGSQLVYITDQIEKEIKLELLLVNNPEYPCKLVIADRSPLDCVVYMDKYIRQIEQHVLASKLKVIPKEDMVNLIRNLALDWIITYDLIVYMNVPVNPNMENLEKSLEDQKELEELFSKLPIQFWAKRIKVSNYLNNKNSIAVKNINNYPSIHFFHIDEIIRNIKAEILKSLCLIE